VRVLTDGDVVQASAGASAANAASERIVDCFIDDSELGFGGECRTLDRGVGRGNLGEEPHSPEGADDASFRPRMPKTMSPMHSSRSAVAGSRNRTMPSTAVPTLPIPVHTA
jgi:hypothetical protein